MDLFVRRSAVLRVIVRYVYACVNVSSVMHMMSDYKMDINMHRIRYTNYYHCYTDT